MNKADENAAAMTVDVIDRVAREAVSELTDPDIKALVADLCALLRRHQQATSTFCVPRSVLGFMASLNGEFLKAAHGGAPCAKCAAADIRAIADRYADRAGLYAALAGRSGLGAEVPTGAVH